MKNSALKRLFAGANIESKNNEEFVNLTNELMASVYGGKAAKIDPTDPPTINFGCNSGCK